MVIVGVVAVTLIAVVAILSGRQAEARVNTEKRGLLRPMEGAVRDVGDRPTICRGEDRPGDRGLRRTHPDLNWGIGSDPEDDELSVVVAPADVELGAVLDDVVGKGAWHWHRRNKAVDGS